MRAASKGIRHFFDRGRGGWTKKRLAMHEETIVSLAKQPYMQIAHVSLHCNRTPDNKPLECGNAR